MSTRFCIASPANGIRIAISGWGKNKMFFKNHTSPAPATSFYVVRVGDVMSQLIKHN